MTVPVTIVEVGPRDGFQGIGPFIATALKLDFLRRLSEAGLRRIEIGSFVSPRALPQMADTPDLLVECRDLPAMRPQVLVPTENHGRRALAANADFLSFVLSVSETHNRNNVRRSPQESAAEYARLCADLPAGADMRLNLATAFDCPFEGRTEEARLFDLLDLLVPIRPGAEICLCDTTGKATPDQVAASFEEAAKRYPDVRRWAMHAHDTYGLGLSNVWSAWQSGVRVFDASFAGLGGCPYAPGATGNVATEDVVWMFERMGIATGIDLAALVSVAEAGTTIPGGQPGGRVRAALSQAGCPAGA